MKLPSTRLIAFTLICLSIGNISLGQDTGHMVSGTTEEPNVSGINDTDWTTTGDVYRYALFLRALEGTINYTNNGNLSTDGHYGFGLHVLAQGDIDVINNGDIETKGTRSDGIHSLSDLGESRVTVGAESRIAVSGQGSTGVFACVDVEWGHSTSDAVIINYGDVSTTGGLLTVESSTYNSHGLRARNMNDGNAIIHNHGTVTVTGESVKALYAQSEGAGNAVIHTAATSVINSYEEKSAAIRAQAHGQGNIYIGEADNYLQGTATATGDNAYGIQGYMYGTGTVYVYNNADVTANGDNSIGVQLAGAGAGGQRGEIHNTGTITGDFGIHVHSGIDGGHIENKGTIIGRSGTAMRLDGKNLVVDIWSTATLTGSLDSNNTGNSLVLNGASGTAVLGVIDQGTHNFAAITKKGLSQWQINHDITLSGSAITLDHQAGRLLVNSTISFENTGTSFMIASGATLAGTGNILNAASFQSGAILEVNLVDAMAGNHMTIGSGSLDGSLSLFNWSTETLAIGSEYILLDAIDGALTGTFNWAEGERRIYGANEYEMRYTSSQVSLIITDHANPIPEPSSMALGLLAYGGLLLRRRK